jgi:hypothetical protein
VRARAYHPRPVASDRSPINEYRAIRDAAVRGVPPQDRVGDRSAEDLRKRSQDVAYQIATAAVIVAFVVIILLIRR